MKLFLAPMADISDLPFREICYDAGADFCYSEMISIKALIMKNKKTLELAKISQQKNRHLFNFLVLILMILLKH